VGGDAVILLDTHIWVWWANNSAQLSANHRRDIFQHRASGLGVSVISWWEVAKLVEKNRLSLSLAVKDWIDAALSLPDVVLLPLSPEIAVESTRLPQSPHGDPADQLIVATARILNIELLTADQRLIKYTGVRTL
jgi:PIN domain nuclease of toxin-antitoxin system